ncbi:MAG: CYTH domain-containing protein [Verrucomicrobiota bacterium]
MAVEIERKFLVAGDSWKAAASDGVLCRQGYLASEPEKTVRVRIIGGQAFLTIKGATTGISRSEFEYEIPVADAVELLKLCGDAIVEKTRYFVGHGGMVWELDVFSGANEGLVLAELELESEEQPFDLPDWAGKEVSGDIRYYNAYLARHPFATW